MCGSSLYDRTHHQNKLEGMVVVIERAWLKPGNWAWYSEKEKGSQEGTEWKSVPKINITWVGHEEIKSLLQIRFCAWAFLQNFLQFRQMTNFRFLSGVCVLNTCRRAFPSSCWAETLVLQPCWELLCAFFFFFFCGSSFCNRSPPRPPQDGFFCERRQRRQAGRHYPLAGRRDPGSLGRRDGEQWFIAAGCSLAPSLSLCPGCQRVTACGQRAKPWKEECVRPLAFSCFIKLQRIARYSASVGAGQGEWKCELNSWHAGWWLTAGGVRGKREEKRLDDMVKITFC